MGEGRRIVPSIHLKERRRGRHFSSRPPPHPFRPKSPKNFFCVPSFFLAFAFALTCSLLMQRRQEESGVGFFLLFPQVSLQIRAISILCVDRHPWSFSSSPADPAEREKEKVLFSLLLLTAGIGFSPPPEPSAENALPLTDRKLDRINSELVFVSSCQREKQAILFFNDSKFWGKLCCTGRRQTITKTVVTFNKSDITNPL